MASALETLLLAQVAQLQNTAVQLVTEQAITTTVASITFSSLPANYNHFKIVWKARGDTSATTTYLYCQINGNTGASYTWQNVKATGTSALGDSSTGADTKIVVGVLTAAGSLSAQYNSGGAIDFPYATDTTNRNVVVATGNAMYNTTSGVAGTYGGSGTYGSPITSITLFPQAGNFTAGLFSLYGWA